MVSVSPMDKHGFFNFSVNTGVAGPICRKADIVIVEVNEHLPRIHGGNDECIHISEVDYIVEGEHEPFRICCRSDHGEGPRSPVISSPTSWTERRFSSVSEGSRMRSERASRIRTSGIWGCIRSCVQTHFCRFTRQGSSRTKERVLTGEKGSSDVRWVPPSSMNGWMTIRAWPPIRWNM